MKTTNGNSLAYKIVNGTAYYAETPDAVIQVLEQARMSRARIRVFYGDVETGRDWMEEHDVMGTVGRSTGQMKAPIMIHTERSISGPIILDNCIVRITIDKRDVYRHPKYNLPELELREHSAPDIVPVQPFSVFADGKEQARFKELEQAERWVKFIKGERNSK